MSVEARLLAKMLRRPSRWRGRRVLVGTGGGASSLGLLAFLVAHAEALGLARVAAAGVETDLRDDADEAERVADAGRAARAFGVDFHALRPAPGRAAVCVLDELWGLARVEGFDRVALGTCRDDLALASLSAVVSGGRLVDFARKAQRHVWHPFAALSNAEAHSLALTHGVEVPVLTGPPPRTGLEGALAASVVPRLRAIAPGVEASLVRLAQEARQALAALSDQAVVVAEAGRRGDGQWEFLVSRFSSQRLFARAVARVILGPEAGEGAVRRLGRLLGGCDGKTAALVAGVSATYSGDRVLVVTRRRGG
ncbi:MAG: hypothetical protein JNK72_01780 [Myxococcales bacterium]|nr:hypothetical protein [Myxococcales bacterium]